MNHQWADFKGDVSMKTLINQLDTAIKRRRRLYYHEDPEENQRIQNFNVTYKRFKPIKLIAMVLYIILPFFEKPGWCIYNNDIDVDTTRGYWYCNNKAGTITNSHMPKLPSNLTNMTYIICLIVVAYYTKARDFYRRRDQKGDTVTLQMSLIFVSVSNLIVTEFVLNLVERENLDNNFFYIFFSYAYINAFMRPILFVLSIRSVQQFWRRYISVIRGSLPMVIFILLFVFYFAWMGNRLFSGTIEGVENFSTLNDSFFFMFVLLTTSNFPDIMLPAYGQ